MRLKNVFSKVLLYISIIFSAKKIEALHLGAQEEWVEVAALADKSAAEECADRDIFIKRYKEPLCTAARKNDAKIIKHLLSGNSNYSIFTFDALYQAIRANALASAQAILENHQLKLGHDEKPLRSIPNLFDLLLKQVMPNGSNDMMQLLIHHGLDKFDIRENGQSLSMNSQEKSLLRKAVKLKKYDMVKNLLHVGANPNTGRSGSILKLAVLNNDVPMAKLLLHYGAYFHYLFDNDTVINIISLYPDNDDKPLYDLSPAMMHLLIDYGAPVDQIGCANPLLNAVFKENSQMLAVLLDRGASVVPEYCLQNNVLHVALFMLNKNPESLYQQDIEKIRLLLYYAWDQGKLSKMCQMKCLFPEFPHFSGKTPRGFLENCEYFDEKANLEYILKECETESSTIIKKFIEIPENIQIHEKIRKERLEREIGSKNLFSMLKNRELHARARR